MDDKEAIRKKLQELQRHLGNEKAKLLQQNRSGSSSKPSAPFTVTSRGKSYPTTAQLANQKHLAPHSAAPGQHGTRPRGGGKAINRNMTWHKPAQSTLTQQNSVPAGSAVQHSGVSTSAAISKLAGATLPAVPRTNMLVKRAQPVQKQHLKPSLYPPKSALKVVRAQNLTWQRSSGVNGVERATQTQQQPVHHVAPPRMPAAGKKLNGLPVPAAAEFAPAYRPHGPAASAKAKRPVVSGKMSWKRPVTDEKPVCPQPQTRDPEKSAVPVNQPTSSVACTHASTSTSGQTSKSAAASQTVQSAQRPQPVASGPGGQGSAAAGRGAVAAGRGAKTRHGLHHSQQKQGKPVISEKMRWKRVPSPARPTASKPLPAAPPTPDVAPRADQLVTSYSRLSKSRSSPKPSQPSKRKVSALPSSNELKWCRAQAKPVSSTPSSDHPVETRSSKTNSSILSRQQFRWKPTSTSGTKPVSVTSPGGAYPTPSKLKWKRVSNKPSLAPPATVNGHTSSVVRGRGVNPGSSRLKWTRVSDNATLAPELASGSSGSAATKPAAPIFPVRSEQKWRRVVDKVPLTRTWTSPRRASPRTLHSKSMFVFPHPSQLKLRRTKGGELGKSPSIPSKAGRSTQSHSSRHLYPTPSELKWQRVSARSPSRIKTPRKGMPASAGLYRWRRLSLEGARPMRKRPSGSSPVSSYARVPSPRTATSRAIRHLPLRHQLKWQPKSLGTHSPHRQIGKRFYRRTLPQRSQLQWQKNGISATLGGSPRKPVSSRYQWSPGVVPVATPNAVQLALYGKEGWKSSSVQRHMRYVRKGLLSPARPGDVVRRRSSPSLHTPNRPKTLALGPHFGSASRSARRPSPSSAPVVTIRGARYQVDPSGRTLKRLSVDSSASATDQPSPNLRLGGILFQATSNSGHYVRSSSADPTLLAREKIRRSIQLIRTTRSRTRIDPANRYCAFYNRFGHCQQGETCPFVHDPDKIAVCTRFLRGLCDKADGTCPLSHSLSKNKVPVCHFFLQGMCPRDNCPYAHVNVGKNAAVCTDFMDGNCPRGEQCTMKHVMVCVNYKARKICRDKKCHFYHAPGWQEADDSDTKGAAEASRGVSDAQEPAAFRKERLREQFRLKRLQPIVIIKEASDDSGGSGSDDDESAQSEAKQTSSPLQTKPSFLR